MYSTQKLTPFLFGIAFLSELCFANVSMGLMVFPGDDEETRLGIKRLSSQTTDQCVVEIWPEELSRAAAEDRERWKERVRRLRPDRAIRLSNSQPAAWLVVARKPLMPSQIREYAWHPHKRLLSLVEVNKLPILLSESGGNGFRVELNKPLSEHSYLHFDHAPPEGGGVTLDGGTYYSLPLSHYCAEEVVDNPRQHFLTELWREWRGQDALNFLDAGVDSSDGFRSEIDDSKAGG